MGANGPFSAGKLRYGHDCFGLALEGRDASKPIRGYTPLELKQVGVTGAELKDPTPGMGSMPGSPDLTRIKNGPMTNHFFRVMDHPFLKGQIRRLRAVLFNRQLCFCSGFFRGEPEKKDP